MFTENPPADLAQYVNAPEGIARLGGSQAIYLKILGRYVGNPAYPSLKEALAQGDMANAELHAHTLKGVAGNLSLTKLYELSTELDTLLKTGESSPALEADLAEAVAKTDEYVAWVLAHV